MKRKARVERAAELVNIKSYAPLELICIDFLTLEPDATGIKNILVITDHFTKYAQAYPTRDQTAKTVATTLWENFICHYGFPRRIHSDQGAGFESELVTELSKVAGTKSHTTPYHPRGNPVERFNRTLLDMLGTLETNKKSNWRKYIKPLVHAYNCTKNDTTGESPYFLMFGRQPLLPIDLCFGIKPRGQTAETHQEYVRDLKHRLRYAYDLATKESEKHQQANKRRWDAKVMKSTISTGDRVLVRNLSPRGMQKLADRWEPVVHLVLDQPDENIPVYKVQSEDGIGAVRTLHRDMLRPCGFISSSEVGNDTDIPENPISSRTRQKSNDVMNLVGEEESTLESSYLTDLNPLAREFTPNPFSEEVGLAQSPCQSEPEKEFMLSESPTVTPSNTGNSENIGGQPPRPRRFRSRPTRLNDYVLGFSVMSPIVGLSTVICNCLILPRVQNFRCCRDDRVLAGENVTPMTVSGTIQEGGRGTVTLCW